MAYVKALRWLHEHPTIFESLQAGTVMGVGDIISQKFIEKKEVLDTKRLVVFSGFGYFFVGPIVSKWYHFLHSKLPFCWPQIKRGVVKMVADQIIMAPTLLACIIPYLELTTGSGTWTGVKEELEKKYTTILINNYKIWPAVQTLNFSLTPVQYQLLVAQLVGVAWNAYLSYAKNADIIDDQEKNNQDKQTEKEDKTE